jgi:hypothetical protein
LLLRLRGSATTRVCDAASACGSAWNKGSDSL